MSYEPCKNPSCKSFGSPHPNCRCYGSFAAGGVASFCSESRPHQPGCEYFADGGMAGLPEGWSLDNTQPAGSTPSAGLPDGWSLENSASPQSQDDQNQYSGGVGQIGAAVEGLAQGVLGPIAPLIETKVLGVKPEDIAGRAEANPWTHGIAEASGIAGGMFFGTGEAALAAKVAGRFTGSKIIQGVITNGLIEGGDEVSKWILHDDQPMDMVGAAQHIGAAAFLGGLTGVLSKGVSKATGFGLKKFSEANLRNGVESALDGFGDAAKYPVGQREMAEAEAKLFYLNNDLPGASMDMYLKGQKAFDDMLTNGISKATKEATGFVAGTASQMLGAGTLGKIAGYNIGKAIAGPVGGMLEKMVGPAFKKYVTPLTIKILASGSTERLLNTISYAERVASGHAAIEKGVESLFHGVGNSGISPMVSAYGDEKERNKLSEAIDEGILPNEMQSTLQAVPPEQPLGFAEGGEVKKPDPQALFKDNPGIDQHFPSQGMLIAQTKGRIYNYLGSLKPPENPPGLLFDAKPDQRQQRKTYEKALDIANEPSGILSEVKNGTIQPDHIAHVKAMYPEFLGLMQRKLTERMMKAKIDEEKPSFKVRQGLSMLMGTSLSGEFEPQSIQAIQASFARNQPQQQQSQGGGQKTSSKQSLSKSDRSFLTGSQALEQRAQRTST